MKNPAQCFLLVISSCNRVIRKKKDESYKTLLSSFSANSLQGSFSFFFYRLKSLTMLQHSALCPDDRRSIKQLNTLQYPIIGYSAACSGIALMKIDCQTPSTDFLYPDRKKNRVFFASFALTFLLVKFLDHKIVDKNDDVLEPLTIIILFYMLLHVAIVSELIDDSCSNLQ